MPDYSLNINGKKMTVNAAASTSMLWILREHLGLTGTKYGCGIAQCGACTIHLNGKPVRACVIPVEQLAADHQIKTIEGLSDDGDHPVQQAWIEAQAPQCGYCQSGQIMQAVALLEENPDPSDAEIKSFMNGNLCRCGTYMRILKAIKLAAVKFQNKAADS